MDGIEGLLARDFGVRPQGKAAPMAAPRAAGSVWPNPRSTSTPSAAPSYDDLFGAPAAPASASSPDSLFESFKGPTASSAAAKTKPAPAPAYDENIFEAFSGLRSSHSSSSTARYDGGDVFGAAAPAYDDVFAGNRSAPPSYDDLLGGFGGKPQAEERKRSAVAEEDDLLGGFGRKPQAEEKKKPVVVEEDDLLGGFGRRPQAEEEKKPIVAEEDQVDMGFDDLIPGFAGSSPPRSRKTNDNNKKRPAVPTSESIASIGRFTDPLEDLDKSANSEGKNVDSTADNDSDSSAFDQVPKSDPLFTAEINGGTKDSHQPSKARDSSPVQSSRNRNPARRSSMEDFGNTMPESHSARYSDIHVDDSVPSSERYNGNAMEDQSPTSTESEDGIWLTVSEIPLLTRPTSAPPPSRSPPLLKQKPLGAKANGKPQMPTYDNSVFDDDKEFERNSSDREEKERRERLEQAREMRLREEKEREKIRLEKERELERQRERERERQAVERATKEARERAAAEARAKAEGEARQRAQRAAVQRAQQEVRERAAAEAKERAARAAAEERERAAAEEKERAAAEAKERERAAASERAAAERAAAERVQQEARKRAERAAVERAAGEARERQAAAAAAAAAATREKQSTADDLESFFGVNAQANSAPKQRSPTVDSMFDPQPQGRETVNGSQRAASTSASTRKAPSATNFGNDLFDIFGASASSEVFQEVEGENEERRRARLERHQRTCERAAKALAEKNERDMQVQREQVERDRIAGTLDFEIKRWAAGKEGNLRALLSTLQYILWPECGWQAVSLTDLITGAAVKKQYRKATLCIHPDKVQQKGATLQQKYIAEKVFDILKEAWNKFNSEELF